MHYDVGNGYSYFVKNGTIFINRHHVIIATVYEKTLTKEGIAELVREFSVLMDGLLLYKSIPQKSV
jgi:hypothetical protein